MWLTSRGRALAAVLLALLVVNVALLVMRFSPTSGDGAACGCDGSNAKPINLRAALSAIVSGAHYAATTPPALHGDGGSVDAAAGGQPGATNAAATAATDDTVPRAAHAVLANNVGAQRVASVEADPPPEDGEALVDSDQLFPDMAAGVCRARAEPAGEGTIAQAAAAPSSTPPLSFCPPMDRLDPGPFPWHVPHANDACPRPRADVTRPSTERRAFAAFAATVDSLGHCYVRALNLIAVCVCAMLLWVFRQGEGDPHMRVTDACVFSHG